MPPTSTPSSDTLRPNYADSIIAVAREAEKNLAPKIEILPGGLMVIIDRQGKVESLERLATAPRRSRAGVKLYEVASFIGYVNRHKQPRHTAIFGRATEKEVAFTAIIDYHAPEAKMEEMASGAVAVDAATAAWAEHRVTVELVLTPEWLRWLGKDRQLLAQGDFAEFIEENMADIVEPDGATMLEVAQGLQGRKDVAFKSGRNLRDGAITLEYSEQVLVGGTANRRDDTFKVPEKFKLALVPFVGANGIEVWARLRYRIGTDGKLQFAYVLDRPFKVIEAAFLLAREEIEGETGLPVALGGVTVPTV